MENGTDAPLTGSNVKREFYSAKEIAGKLGINEKTLYQWAKRPKLRKRLPPFLRLGGYPDVYRFPIAAYEQWKGNIGCTR